jgi:predicted extracellular nuclease
MESVKILDHQSKKEGDKIIVTKTVEETLTQTDIFNLKNQLNAQKQNVMNQVQQMQDRVSMIETQEAELDSYLRMLEGQPE